ncbi:MAG TPA: hypothetical protein VN706_04610 [Gemmatimonadaceae bacterium]|nr:hypothetical protein [Gemmatimonadaceae bacterium]
MTSGPSEYRIEKVRRRVSLVMAGGERLHGDIFLQPTARYHSGPQEPLDLLNESDAFLPVDMDGRNLSLVAKDQIIRVQYEERAADTEMDGVALASVEIHCTDGSVVGGTIRLETRADRPRLLDFLNGGGDHERFLRLRMPNGVCLVNRRQIAQVRHR